MNPQAETEQVPPNRRLLAHGGVLALLLLLAMPFIGVHEGFVNPDEGIVDLASRHLNETGSWRAPYPLADVDPLGRFVPLNQERYAARELMTYPTRPAYIHLNRILYRLAGAWGPAAMGNLLVAATAYFAGRAVEIIDRRAAVAALWLCGIGTPLLFNATVLQGHQFGALASAVLAYFAVASTNADLRTRSRHAVIALVLVALACQVRRETVFVALAVAAWSGWRFIRNRDRTGLTLGVATTAGAVIGMAAERLIDRAAFGTFETVHVPVLSHTGDLFTSRVVAINESILTPSLEDGSAADLISLVGLCLLVFGAALLYVRADVFLATAGLVILTVIPAVRALSGPDGVALVPGLFFAAPVLVAGLTFLRVERVRGPAMQYLVVASLVIPGLVIATQYTSSWDWGGRFLLLAMPPLAALSALGWESMKTDLPERSARILTTAGAASVVVLAATAALVHHDNRTTTGDLVDQIVASADENTVIASVPVWLPRFDPRQLGDLGYTWAWVPHSDLGEFVELIDPLDRWDRLVVALAANEDLPVDHPGWAVVEGPRRLPTINEPMAMWVLERR